MTNEEALYQAKLIIEQLPENEYNMLPSDKVKYINENFKYNESITINPDIPLEEQNLDEKTIDILDNLVTNIDYLELGKYNENVVPLKLKIMNLENSLDELKFNSNSKMSKANQLVKEYKDALEEANKNITKLKKSNEELYIMINRMPKILRKLFLKQDASQYYLGN